MASVFNNIEDFFKQKTIFSNLIAINIVVFIVIFLFRLLATLFNSEWSLLYYLQLPSSIPQLISKPWTLLTYMFVHTKILHIGFNLLWLYWFGKIFLLFFNPKQFFGLYIIGGLTGALFFIVSYNVFPYFAPYVGTPLIGASASIMAIVFATSFYRKDYEINLLFLGRVKLYYIAIVIVVLDIIAMAPSKGDGLLSDNIGGHIAHLGGIAAGIIFAIFYKKGRDITSSLNKLMDGISNLFKKKPPKKKMTIRRPETDYEYNSRKKEESDEIDRILDKIKKSGYGSLNNDEKKRLFDASKK